MPAYIVALPDVGGLSALPNDKNRFVVWAADATGAKQAVKDSVRNGALDALVDDATTTVTAIAAAADFANWNLVVTVTHPTTGITVNSCNVVGGVLGAKTIAIGAAGTGYTVGDVVTVSGGTRTRGARVKVLTAPGGVPATIGLVDAGDYSVASVGAQATVGGSGTGLTINISAFSTNDLANVLAAAASVFIAQGRTASVDLTNGAGPLLTLAAIGDNIGNHIVGYNFSKEERVTYAAAIGAKVDAGIAGAVLSLRFAAAAQTDIPTLIAAYR